MKDGRQAEKNCVVLSVIANYRYASLHAPAQKKLLREKFKEFNLSAERYFSKKFSFTEPGYSRNYSIVHAPNFFKKNESGFGVLFENKKIPYNPFKYCDEEGNTIYPIKSKTGDIIAEFSQASLSSLEEIISIVKRFTKNYEESNGTNYRFEIPVTRSAFLDTLKHLPKNFFENSL